MGTALFGPELALLGPGLGAPVGADILYPVTLGALIGVGELKIDSQGPEYLVS